MKRIKILLLLLLVGIFSGCQSDQEKDPEPVPLRADQIYAYYVNMDKTGLVQVVYTCQYPKDILSETDALMKKLSQARDTETQAKEEYIAPIPEGINYKECRLGSHNGTIEVAFDISYDAPNINAENLLFFKGCVVKTLLQLDGVEWVTILLEDVANSDSETATTMESFNADSFAMSFGGENGYVQKGNIVLYFANENGEYLKDYQKTVEISNNTSLARLVVESLIEGPETEGYQPTISSKTTVRNISVKDGICYVDLSDEFYDNNNKLRNEIIVYSVVNSLVELPTVSKVQFLKNGEKQQFFRETLPFDGIFERNLDLIEEEENEE